MRFRVSEKPIYLVWTRKWARVKVPKPSKCVLDNVKTNWLGGARKMRRPKKRACRNWQLLALEWSIFAGRRRRRRRRYFSER